MAAEEEKRLPPYKMQGEVGLSGPSCSPLAALKGLHLVRCLESPEICERIWDEVYFATGQLHPYLSILFRNYNKQWLPRSTSAQLRSGNFLRTFFPRCPHWPHLSRKEQRLLGHAILDPWSQTSQLGAGLPDLQRTHLLLCQLWFHLSNLWVWWLNELRFQGQSLQVCASNNFKWCRITWKQVISL